MSYLFNKNALCAVALLFISFRNSYATTVLVLVGTDGIVIGTDSKAVPVRVGGYQGNLPPTHIKSSIVSGRFVVADIGASEIHVLNRAGAPVFEFNLKSRIMQIEKNLPYDASVTDLTQIIEKDMNKAFKEFDPRADGATRENNPVYILRIVVAGYQAGVPIVNRVNVDIDWVNNEIKPSFTEHLCPSTNGQVKYSLSAMGNYVAISQITDNKSEPHREVVALAPKEFGELLARHPLSSEDGKTVLRDCLRVEAKHNHGWVGAPFRITVIPRVGPAIETVYPD